MMVTNRTDALIFDMDGTLWDAIDSYATIWNMAFKRIDHPCRVTRAELLSLMGTPIDDIVSHFVDAESTPRLLKTISELEITELPRLGGKLYPGVHEGIAQLARHYKLFILSNCDEKELPIFVHYAKLESYITATLAYGDTQLPKAENIRLLTQQHNLQSPVYIGDTDGDCRESRKAKVPFIWVSYGFGQTKDYDYAFDTFTEMTNFLITLKNETTK